MVRCNQHPVLNATDSRVAHISPCIVAALFHQKISSYQHRQHRTLQRSLLCLTRPKNESTSTLAAPTFLLSFCVRSCAYCQSALRRAPSILFASACVSGAQPLAGREGQPSFWDSTLYMTLVQEPSQRQLHASTRTPEPFLRPSYFPRFRPAHHFRGGGRRRTEQFPAFNGPSPDTSL